jgi:hypothetical protein
MDTHASCDSGPGIELSKLPESAWVCLPKNVVEGTSHKPLILRRPSSKNQPAHNELFMGRPLNAKRV